MTKATATATVKIGDVFTRSWGYDQTNVDYYEIVSVSKTGKTAKARQLRTVAAAVHPDDDPFRQSDLVCAAIGPDRFADARCSRCSNHHRDEAGWDGHAFTDLYTWQARHDRLTVTSYGDHAYRWDGQPDYQTATGWGH